MTVLCWGAYGPILHKGQLSMLGSRLRPFICVGWAYVTVGIVMPLLLIPMIPAESSATSYWSMSGTLWSLLGGSAWGHWCAGNHHGIHAWWKTGLCDAFGIWFGSDREYIFGLQLKKERLTRSTQCFTRGSSWRSLVRPWY